MPATADALPRMLDELSRMGEADRRAILDGLDPAARSRAEAMLSGAAPREHGGAAQHARKGLSGWLIALIEEGTQIAPATRDALLAGASRLPDEATGDPVAPVARRTSLVSRIAGRTGSGIRRP